MPVAVGYSQWIGGRNGSVAERPFKGAERGEVVAFPRVAGVESSLVISADSETRAR